MYSLGILIPVLVHILTSPIDWRGSRSIYFFSICWVTFRPIIPYYIIIFQAREPPEIIGGPAGTFPEDMVMIRYM